MRIEDCLRTCSIDKPLHMALTFARKVEYLHKLHDVKGKRILVMVPAEEIEKAPGLPGDITLLPIPRQHLDYEFTVAHNKINRGKDIDNDVKGWNVFVHPTVIIHEGIHVCYTPDGGRMQMAHMGNVIFEDDVWVGAGTIIERGVLTGCSTILRRGAKVDCGCRIGHGAEIGEQTVMAMAAKIGASCKIGRECWIANDANVKPHTNVCDGVVIGTGSNVIKDIDKPGMWAGNPARYLKEVPKGWMW